MGFPFAGKLEKLIEEKELYRKGDLTLQELVQLVGSNRTYLSPLSDGHFIKKQA